jgi:hypothetical protein
MRYWILALIVLLAAGPMWADIVYLNDGSEISGQVRQADDKVYITKSDGSSVVVRKDDVLYIAVIAPPPAEDPADAEPPAVPPAEEPSPPPSAAPDIDYADAAIHMDRIVMPESVMFLLMRQRHLKNKSTSSLEHQIRTYRMFAHDRKRHVNNQWLTPAQLKNLLDKCRSEAAQAGDAAKAASRLDPNTEADAYRKEINQAMRHWREFASYWPDSLLQPFLIAEWNRVLGDNGKARGLLHGCVERAPYLPLFHQGLAHALETTDELASLQQYAEVLRLLPGETKAVQLLRAALKNTPGKYIYRPEFRDAEKLLESFEQVREGKKQRRKQYEWLFPTKSIRVSSYELPVPPFDRIIVRQAMAFPVGDHALLADESIQDAEMVYLDAGEGRFLPAEVERINRQSISTQPPLCGLVVPNGRFSPIEIPTDPDEARAVMPAINQGDILWLRTVSCYAGMGEEVREGKIVVLGTEDGAPTFSQGLLAGETSAPVLSGDGSFAGILGGKTEVQEEPHPQRFFPLFSLCEYVEKVNGSVDLERMKKNNPLPATDISGRAFRVIAITIETLQP